MITLRCLLSVISCSICNLVFCQVTRDNERHTHLEFEPKTVEISRDRDNSDRGSANRHEPSEYMKPVDRTLPYSIVPLGYPEGISPSHKSSLQALNYLLKSISGIQKLLAGSPLLDFATEHPEEMIASVALKVINGDYQSIAGGIVNLESIKQQQIADLAIQTKLDLDKEYRDAGDNYMKREEVKQEIKFWERMELQVLISPTSNIPLSDRGKFTTAFTRSRPLLSSLSFSQVKVGNSVPFNAFLVRPGTLHLIDAENKDVRLHVLIEYSQDSTFGDADVYGDASYVGSTDQMAYLQCTSNDFTCDGANFIYIPEANFTFTYGKLYYLKFKIYCYINDIQQTVSKLNIYTFNTYSKTATFYRYGNTKESKDFNKQMSMPYDGYNVPYH